MQTKWWMAGVALVAALPAGADVKAGVEAWTRGDFKAAVEQWRGPALAGDADAQFNMGQAYKLGRGVPAADLRQAEDWYRRAAAQGHAQAVDNYGLALFGDGRRADALPWLEKSAARDERRAELVLGTMLFNGDAVPKDWVRAYALVTRASQQGLDQGSKTLAQMDGFVSSDQREKGIALAATIAAAGKAAQLQASAPTRIASAAAAGSRPASSLALAKSPPTTRPEVMPRAALLATPRPTPTPAVTPTKAAKSTLAMAPKPTPITIKPALTPAGAFRIQLGAFKADGGAQAQWSKLSSRLAGVRPDYIKAGAFTRLVAGPYRSKADATAACAKVSGTGAACMVAGK